MRIIFSTLIGCICFCSYGQKDSIINKQIESYYNRGEQYFYQNIDSTHKYLMKSYELADQISDTDSKLVILNSLIVADGYHFQLEKLEKDIHLMDSIMANDKSVDSLEFKKAYEKFLITSKGGYYYKLNNFSKAKPYFNQVLKTLDSIKGDELSQFDLSTKISILEYLASISRNEGKNNLAKQYYDKILNQLKLYKFTNWETKYYGAKYRLSQVYANEKEFKEANRLQKEALNFFKSKSNDPRYRNSLKANYQITIKSYIIQDSLDTALGYLEESKSLYTKNDPFLKKLDLLNGEIYTKKQEYIAAEEYYLKALEAIKKYRKNQKHQDIAKAFFGLGRLYVAKDDPKKALQFYQEALMQLAPDFDNTEIKNNPDPKKVLSKLELVKVLKEKLETLQLLYQKTNKIEDLKIAFATSHDVIGALDLLKPEFESKVDKQFLLSEMYPAFHSMVTVAYDLYKTTNESTYIADAFYFAEKSKSVLLLEAARSTQASSYGGVPEQIIDKEQQFRANIIHLEKKFFNQKSNMIVFDSLFQLKNKYYNFISDIERDYPKYYDLKYNAEVVSLEETASEIIKGKALLSYFSTYTNLFLITVENDKKNFYKIPLGNGDRERITKFYSLLSMVNSKDLPNIYKEGYLIYKKLLKNALQEIQSKELVIIPDDVLNYLPFEALSTAENPENYLIQEYQISYTNSATLLREQQNKLKIDKNQLLAYAPSFGKTGTDIQQDRSNFGPLLYNTDEVGQITKFFDGKAVTGNKASLVSFSENSQAYNMLHFATHAAANDEHPDYSYLAFAPNDKGENSLLYVKDLYGYSINADLVALSACQTGLGKLQKGEGMLSLARGFSYAGAKSLVTTLWKINDQTTSQLMQDFYENLDASLPKDKALREAKLTYLKTTEDELLTHPYYWSGFMISGDMTPLKTDSSYLWWLLLLGIPILVVVVRKVRSLL